MKTLGWTVGIQRHPDEPVVFIHCQDVKKIPPPSGIQSWLTIPPTGSTPAVPRMGASTVAHTSRDSRSVTALPPDEGVDMADVDSEQNEQSMLRYTGSIRTNTRSEGDQSSLRAGSANQPAILFAPPVVRIDDTSVLHPYFPKKSDAGPVRLMTIAHAFNYRMAVLRNGMKSAVRVARAKKGGGLFSPKFGHSMGTPGSGDVPNNIYDGGRITVVSGRIRRVKWYAAECTVRFITVGT